MVVIYFMQTNKQTDKSYAADNKDKARYPFHNSQMPFINCFDCLSFMPGHFSTDQLSFGSDYMFLYFRWLFVNYDFWLPLKT